MKKANQVDPKDTLVLMNLGNVSLKLGDSASARKYYEEIVKVDPNGEYAQDARGRVAETQEKVKRHEVPTKSDCGKQTAC
jgi:Tfp pilus assembly protein PilF